VENGTPHTRGEQHSGERPSASLGQMPALMLMILVLAISVLGLATAALASGSSAQLPPMILPGSASASSGDAAASTSERWIIGARPGAASKRIAAAAGAQPVGGPEGIYSIDPDRAERFADRLQRAGVLVFAEPDVPMLPAGYPAEVNGESQWWLNRIINTVETTPPPVTPNSPGLGLVEESLDPLHPDLAEANLEGALSIGPVEDSHGTSIAAIAGSPAERSSVGGQNIVGVWPGMNMTLFPSGNTCLSATKAVLQAAKARVPVINMSYGFAGTDCFSHYVATETAVRAGVLPIASAGNTFSDGGNLAMRPAFDPHVISVSAVDRADLIAPFATRNSKVDITAPGDGLFAPVVQLSGTGDGTALIDRTWSEIRGTSFSAPMVAAAATWLSQARPGLDDRQIGRVLTGSATDLGTPGRDSAYGEGLLNVDAALAAKSPPADPREPNDDITWINGSLLTKASGDVWKPSLRKKRAWVNATLSLNKDAADVYPVRLAPRSRMLIKVAQLQGDVTLRVFRPTAQTITRTGNKVLVRSDRVRPKTEGVLVKNSKGQAQVVYVAITPSSRQSDEYMRYRVSVVRR